MKTACAASATCRETPFADRGGLDRAGRGTVPRSLPHLPWSGPAGVGRVVAQAADEAGVGGGGEESAEAVSSATKA